MAYLLDSDVIIDFLKNKEPGFSLVSGILGKSLYISVVSWAEVIYGIKKSKHPEKRMKEFEKFLESLKIIILPINELIAYKFVELKITLEKRGQRLADFDLLIASSAMINKLFLVTRNSKHFSRIAGLKAL